MKKHYPFIDCVKGIAILSIVLGHLFASVSQKDPLVNLVGPVSFMSIYEVALFFVVSGFLMGEREQSGMHLKIRPYLLKRTRKCMTVYGIMSLVYLLGDWSAENILYALTGFGISVLWFLPTLVLSEAVFLLIRRIKFVWLQVLVSVLLAAASCFCGNMIEQKEDVSILIQIGICILILLMRALIGQLFVEIGCLLHWVINHTPRMPRIIGTAVCFGIGIAGSLWNEPADWRVMNIKTPFIWLFAAVAMCAGIMMLFYEMENLRIRLRPLEEIGKESLLIMCTHMYFGVMSISMDLGYQFASACAHAKSYVFWGTAVLSLAVFECFFILLKRYAQKWM